MAYYGSTLKHKFEINQKTMTGRSGIESSEQVADFDTITNLDTEDFSLDGNLPFQIKNEGDSNVILSVVPAGNGDHDNTAVPTKFYPGWNPEIVRKIEKATVGVTLKWGY